MNYIDVLEGWGANDDASRVQVTQRFLDASSADDYGELLRGYPLMFGDKSSPASIDDVRMVCELLRVAQAIYALWHSDGPVTFEELHGCGMSPAFGGAASIDTPTSEISPDSFAVHFSYRVNGGAYATWLSHAVQTIGERSVCPTEAVRYGGGLLFYRSQTRGVDSGKLAREDCAAIFENLMNLHLVDVATVCGGFTARPQQVAYSGVSLLWLGLIEMLGGGRSFRCEACGKPTVAYAERRKRRFCCDACRKWAHTHPGEKRSHWYIEKR